MKADGTHFVFGDWDKDLPLTWRLVAKLPAWLVPAFARRGLETARYYEAIRRGMQAYAERRRAVATGLASADTNPTP